MKINFEQLRVYNDIAKTREMVVNVKVQVADTIYQKGIGIEAHALALKIYNSTGDCELTDDEYQLLVSFAEHHFIPMVIDALKGNN